MSDVTGSYLEFIQNLKPGVELVAVSKTKPEEEIMALYSAGHRDFGENKVQELARKAMNLPGDIKWHMIGHLQTNKVKYIAPFVHLIHAVDSLKLLKIINKEASKNSRVIDCLLQMHIATEETKYGMDETELRELLEDHDLRGLDHINITGLMGMATFTEDLNLIREEFRKLKTIFDRVKKEYFPGMDDFNRLSMGMSNDFQIAVEEGATIIRIGSLIFGERNYSNQ